VGRPRLLGLAAARDGEVAFRTEVERAVAEELVPALRRYRDFVAGEYALHEAVPGHHLQIALAKETAGVPVARWIGNSAYSEGWGLYAEGLAEEMGLYTSDVDRMGRLSFEALRAARLVVDSGIHAMGWSRQQAIDYLLENTTLNPGLAASEVDRYAAVPGQAVSYLLGARELRRLRSEAERALGRRFDIRAFHDVVLGAGTLPLGALRERMEAWVKAAGAGS
jgi:uncharacterized protein (DUF885 family)